MSVWQAIILGLVQGVTEFLPISSSAHLILVPYLFDWPDAGLRFAVITNAGTLLAAIVYFRRMLIDTLRHPEAAMLEDASRPGAMRGAVVGTLPVAVAGLLFHDLIAGAARTPLVIAITTLGFGLLLGWADWTASQRRGLDSLRWLDVAVIGLAQALALVPGTSRSGITMTAALGLGLRRPAAARFSFLLAIPVGVLALGKDLADLALVPHGQAGASHPAWLALTVGFVVSACTAYGVIEALLRLIARSSFIVFTAYRISLGIFLLVLLVYR